ncbi:MAG: sulfite exporter TauE/SafE family protein [Kofleriaceae bacterium]
MDLPLTVFLVLMATSAVASGVNGALGYGFSSIMVPVSLTMISGRLLNPALVLLEVVLNLYSLFLHRGSVRGVWPRVRPILAGLLPGVIVGGLAFGLISAQLLKASTYALILPMVALQSFSLRWRVRSEPRWGVPFGFGLGTLYATTTVSGPPLALYFTNLGLVQDEFRAALAVVRVVESITTLVMYALVGALSSSGFALAGSFLPVVLIGLAVGRRLVSRIDRASFGRFCMRLDAALVTVGLALTISAAGWMSSAAAWLLAISLAVGVHLLAAAKARQVAALVPTAEVEAAVPPTTAAAA